MTRKRVPMMRMTRVMMMMMRTRARMKREMLERVHHLMGRRGSILITSEPESAS